MYSSARLHFNCTSTCINYFAKKLIYLYYLHCKLFVAFSEKVVKSRIFEALKSIENRTCIKFIQDSNLALLVTSVLQKFGVVFSSSGNRFVLCNVKCLREKISTV